jgi:hypothetical protein
MEGLALRRNQLADLTFVLLSRAMKTCALIELDVSRNSMGLNGVGHLARLLSQEYSLLEKVNLSECRLTADSLVKFSINLTRNNCLKELNLSNNSLNPLPQKTGYMLAVMSKLSHLRLNSCRLGNASALLLFDTLRDRSLALLELRNNCLEGELAIAGAEAIDLSYNALRGLALPLPVLVKRVRLNYNCILDGSTLLAYQNKHNISFEVYNNGMGLL